jgi:hypothetical protein
MIMNNYFHSAPGLPEVIIVAQKAKYFFKFYENERVSNCLEESPISPHSEKMNSENL